MTAAIFRNLTGMSFATGRSGSIRGTARPDRRRTFSLGLETLEGRLAPTGIAPITVTVTNQDPVQAAPTSPPAPTVVSAPTPPSQQVFMA